MVHLQNQSFNLPFSPVAGSLLCVDCCAAQTIWPDGVAGGVDSAESQADHSLRAEPMRTQLFVTLIAHLL